MRPRALGSVCGQCLENGRHPPLRIHLGLQVGTHLVRIMEQPGVDPPDHLLGPVAQQLLGAGIEQVHHPIDVGGDHRNLIGCIHHRLQALAHVGRVLPGLLQIGDVGMGTCHPQWVALRIAFVDAATVLHPDPVALLVAHPAQAVVVRRAALQMRAEQRVGLGQIVGMHQPEEGLGRDRGEFLAGVAHDLCPALVDPHLPARNVPVPGAGRGAFDDHFQPMALLGHLTQRFGRFGRFRGTGRWLAHGRPPRRQAAHSPAAAR